MARPLELGGAYAQALRRLSACCLRVEALRKRRSIAITECDLIVESAFLNAVSRFEGLLEDLLEEFVCGTQVPKVGHGRLIEPRSRSVFRVLLQGDRPYIDLLPYSTCTKVAKRFLVDGRPFVDVDENDQRIIGQALLIRNAIAHRSGAALKKFREKVPGVKALSPNRQFPGPFLRRVYKAHPDQTWLSLYLDTLEKAGMKLAVSW